MQNPRLAARTLPNDPLLSQQWYLSNTRPAGYDLNLQPVWSDYTGRGVRVAVCDDGVQSTHPDLAYNYDARLSYNFVRKRPGGDPTSPDSNHGTSVAGIIAAVANNGKGGAGVAHDATLGSLVGGTLAEIAACFDFAVDKGIDIVNNSWGFDPFQDGGYDSRGLKASMQRAVENGRDGLGILMTFAAGNEREEGWDVNLNAINSSPYAIAVAAVNLDGTLSSYSTPGSSILVSGPGGESTVNSPGLVTTDRSGRAGYTSNDYYQTDYDGYVGFNGTSAATPTVSGVIALMLEANPDLGYRDVQEILANSARMSDPGHSDWAWNQASHWNGGGMHTSRDFGFGLIDAQAAVRLAETWDYEGTYDNLTIAEVNSRPLNFTIPDASSRGVSSQLRVNKNLELDHVTATLHLRHGFLQDLQIELVAPSGTRSVLLDNTTGEPDSTDFTWTFSSTQFWGENSQGNWTLTVFDQDRGVVGRLMDWSLTLYGDEVSVSPEKQDTVYIYTNEYARFKTSQDVLRRTLTDAGGDDTINVAAITDPVSLDLNPGAISRLAGGIPLRLSVNTLIETAYAGDGDDYLLGNIANNWLDGGRGTDTLAGGDGADTLIGAAGQDWLSGGGGADLFLITDDSTITDFSALEGDRLDLTAAAAQRFTYIGNRPFTGGSSSQLRWDNPNQTLQADRDGDLQADLNINLAGVTALTADALILA